MNKMTYPLVTIGLVLASWAAYPDQGEPAKPEVIAKSDVMGMPTTPTQEIRVLTATLQPGARSVFHTHRSPVTAYVLEGTMTLETESSDPAVYSAGQVFFEKPDMPTTAYNASSTDPTKVIIFYVSDLDTPFLDPISQ